MPWQGIALSTELLPRSEEIRNYCCIHLLSTAKVIKMQARLNKRLRKLLFFALIGCFAYFAGYIWGQLKLNPSESPQSAPQIQESIGK
jgi:hypothetical protein